MAWPPSCDRGLGTKYQLFKMADEAEENICPMDVDEMDDDVSSLEPTESASQSNFIKSPKIRAQYNRRSLKSMQNKLNKWHEKTRCPLAFIAFSNGQIYFAGPSHMESFAKNQFVIDAFMDAAMENLPEFGQQNKKQDEENNGEFVIQLDPEWKTLNIYGKRQLLIALVTKNQIKRAQWNNNDCAPSWWPRNIRFRDPNNDKPRMKLWELNEVISAYDRCYSNTESLPTTQPHPTDPVSAEPQPPQTTATQSSTPEPVSTDPQPPETTATQSSTPEPVSAEPQPRKTTSTTSSTSGAVAAEPQPRKTTATQSSTPEPVSAEPQPPENTTTQSAWTRASSSSSRMVSAKDQLKNLETILSKVELFDDEECLPILKFLHGLKEWSIFSECCQIISREIGHYCSLKIQENVKYYHVEIRCRHCVPEQMLKKGYEPVKVHGDGNCFFRAVSTLCSRLKETDWRRIKLGAILDAAKNEDLYIEQIMSHDDPLAYLYTMTTEEVMALVPSYAAGGDAVRLAFQNEVMMTSKDGRYSGLLQVQMASNFLEVPIQMHCREQGYEVYNTVVYPRRPFSKNQNPVNILWCKLTSDAIVPNHLTPLIFCPQSQTAFNTFHEEMQNKKCGSDNSCQFLDTASHGPIGNNLIQCQHCLIWYHSGCAHFIRAPHQRHFSCGCAIYDDQKWVLEIQEQRTWRKFFQGRSLIDYLKSIVTKDWPSIRFALYCRKSGESRLRKRLRGLGGFGPGSNEVIEYRCQQIETKLLCPLEPILPEEVLNDQFALHSFKINVLIPETIIWMIGKLCNTSRVNAERLFFQ